jgi:hypothetical protein
LITENLSTLKINKLTQAQYDKALTAGNIDNTAFYLTTDDNMVIDGDLVVQGDFTVHGSSIVENTVNLEVQDALTVVNSTGVDISAAKVGHVFRKDASTAYGILYDPVNNNVRLGVGSYDAETGFTYDDDADHPIALRDRDGLTSNNFVIWDDSRSVLKDSGIVLNDSAVKFNKGIDADGYEVKATSFWATSDRRLKTDIVDYQFNDNSILDLPIYSYKYKATGANSIGIMAQDLQEIYPDLVTTNDDGYLSINETKLIYLLLNEVKLLRNKVNELSK